MDLNFFFGRFHIVLVHLPIGLLLMAAAMHFLSQRDQFQKLNSAVSFALFWGVISAILTAGCGWLLANEGVYVERTLFLHRWLGIGVAVTAGFCWLLKKGKIKVEKRSFSFSIIILVLLIILTGHFGGNLTHGEGYLLKYAPASLKAIFEAKSQTIAAKQQFSDPDSTFIFNNLLLPFLKQKCGDCHNDENKKGGLSLTSKEGFLKGGDHDEIFTAGNGNESEIFVRVTLPRNDEKFMPPKGEVLSYDQIRLLEWWITEGADFEKSVSEYDLSKDIEMLLLNNYGLETKAKNFVETIEVPPLPDAVFQKLKTQNFKVTRLAANNNLLEISLKPGLKKIDLEQIEMLLEAKAQITWLNLGNAEIIDDHLQIINKLENITRLRLEQTSISDKGVAQLTQLTNLESLNLYGTSVSDKSIEFFIKMPALKKVYLWQTKLSLEGLEKLKTSRPDLEIVAGLELSTEN